MKQSAPSSEVARTTEKDSTMTKTLKSRAEQRADELGAKRLKTMDKNKMAAKYEHFLDSQAKAAREVVALSADRLDMEVIQMGYTMGCNKELLDMHFAKLMRKRGMSLTVDEKKTPGEEMKEKSKHGADGDDTVVVIEKDEESVVDLVENSSEEVGSDTMVGGNASGFPTGRCCMGVDCKHPDRELRHKCVTCNCHVHAIDCAKFDLENDDLLCINCSHK